MKGSIVEISKKTNKAGRTPIKLILHEIYRNEDDYNGNGIHWVKEFAENNIESVKGMPIVAQFMDSDHKIPFGSHGNMEIIEENKVIFEDSLVVGSFDSAEIIEDIEINNEKIDALVGSGYLYDQRFPELVEYLQTEYNAGNSIEGSIEICASKGNSKIIYDGGWKAKNRRPKEYDYSGHALVIGETAADRNALLLELNTKIKEVNSKVGENMQIELNKISYEDIVRIVENLFNEKFNKDKDSYTWFYIHKFYPEDSTFVMKSWSNNIGYYQTTYSINESKVEIGNIEKVEEDWKPVSGSNAVEVNSSLLNIYKNFNKEVKSKMDEKIVLELNQKIEEKVNEINSLNKDIETKATEINSLNTKVSDLEAKVTELSDTIVEVNKKLETEKAEKENLTVEVNSFRADKEKQEAEAKKVEVNTYFETEIPKNGFDETEVNSLKEYVEKCDLEGLKNAEKELVFKKFKAEKETSVETNSTKVVGNMFISTKIVDEKKANAGKIPTFFN